MPCEVHVTGNGIVAFLFLGLILVIINIIRAARHHARNKPHRVSDERYRKLWVVDENNRKGNHED